MLLLSTAYFPPIEYFAAIARYSVVFMENAENYVKQSYRNRCRILTSNGVEDLRVPVLHGESRLITDVRIDYKMQWVRQSKYAIDSAYFNSPFFEYYRDDLFTIMDSCPPTLWELNRELTAFFCRKVGLESDFSLTGEYRPFWEDCEDLRDVIHPKKASAYEPKKYYQVFSERFGFVPGLSIMDLLFNEGPESICYL